MAVLPTSDRLTDEAVTWAYRLFLDREPESRQAVENMIANANNHQELRQIFLSSQEFQLHNRRNDFAVSLAGYEPPLPIDEVVDLGELFFHIQRVWNELGETEPHWSVLTAEKFKSARIEESRQEFFHSGLQDVAVLLRTLERNGIDPARLETCLEFGCGLGRLTCWLARNFVNVIGYDISRSHLQLAGDYLQEEGLDNVSLQHLDHPNKLRDLPRVDLAFSLIVLQHNPPPIIRLILEQIFKSLTPGGVAVLQVPTYELGYRFSLAEYLATAVRNPVMEFHVLPQKEVFAIATRQGCYPLEVLEDDKAGLEYGRRSNTFVIQKQS